MSRPRPRPRILGYLVVGLLATVASVAQCALFVVRHDVVALAAGLCFATCAAGCLLIAHINRRA